MVGSDDVHSILIVIHEHDAALGDHIGGRTREAQVFRLTATQQIPAHQRGRGTEILAAGLYGADHIVQNIVLIKAHAAHIGLGFHTGRKGLGSIVSTHDLECAGGRIIAAQALIMHACQIHPTLTVIDGVGKVGVETALQLLVGQLASQILHFLSTHIDPLQDAVTGSEIDVIIAAHDQTVAGLFRHLAIVPNTSVGQVDAVQMSLQETDGIVDIVDFVVSRAIQRFTLHGNAPVLHNAGFGVIGQQRAAGVAGPGIMIIGQRHPGRMLRGFVGGMRQRDHPAIIHPSHAGMQLTGTDKTIIGENVVLGIMQGSHSIFYRIINCQLGILAGSQFGAKRKIYFPLFAQNGIPTRIMHRRTGQHALAYAGLVHDAVGIFILCIIKKRDHYFRPPDCNSCCFMVQLICNFSE